MDRPTDRLRHVELVERVDRRSFLPGEVRAMLWSNEALEVRCHMASTLACVYYHVIFGTKERYPFISDNVGRRLHSYISGIICGENGVPIIVGGTADHVHILFAMRTEPSLGAMVGKIKSNSSKWMHDTFPQKAKFAWQSGYGVFSVSVSNVDEAKAYIASQTEHHRKRTFQQEYVAFLKKHAVEYDPRYLWT